MPHFIDYHRTAVGYHGTRRSVALELVQRLRPFDVSDNPDDWLGHGVYFWEHGPQQAFRWAEQRRQQQGWDEPVAVVASMIRLGRCLDLLDPVNAEWLAGAYDDFVEAKQSRRETVPRNVRSRKWLDCAVLEHWHAALEGQGRPPVDTLRAAYFPATVRRLWPGSWLSHDNHIQLCVRNLNCIVGTWLVEPLEAT